MWLTIPIESIKIEKLSAAMTNTVYIISHSRVDCLIDEPKKLLLRIYGKGTDKLFNRYDELSWFYKFSQAHAGPQLLAAFKNGRIEEYIESLTLTPNLMRKADISLEIAKALAKFHRLNVEIDTTILNEQDNFFEQGQDKAVQEQLVQYNEQYNEQYHGHDNDNDYDYSNNINYEDYNETNTNTNSCYNSNNLNVSITWSRLYTWRQEALKSFKTLRKNIGNNFQLSIILDKIKSFKVLGETFFGANEKYGRFLKSLQNFNCPIVPCHNDLQHGNILWSHEKERIVLIDYEYGGMNYAAYDISNHFCEWAGDYTEDNLIPHVMDFEKNYPSLEAQERFIRKYLKEYYESTNYLYVPIIVTDELVLIWMQAVDSFKNLSHLLWAYWGIIQANNSTNDSFDYLRYALMRLEALNI